MNRKRRFAHLLIGKYDEKIEKLAYAASFERYFRSLGDTGPVFPESYADRKAIHDHVAREVIGPNPIDYLEFGVYQGESIGWWTELSHDPASRFFGFDTFTGLPEAWKDKKKGAFDVMQKTPDIDDPRVRFVQGIFQESLRPFLKDFERKNRLVIHLDADLYSSTLFCLTTLDELIVPNAVLIFDEFSSLAHEYAAFRDYQRSFNRSFRLLCRTEGYEHVAFACN